jgi:hypothetical protein
MRLLIVFCMLVMLIGCESKKVPEGEPNFPTVGTPPPPPSGMIGKKGSDYTKGINPKQ